MKKEILFGFFLLFFASIGHAEVRSVDSLDPIVLELEQNVANTLVLLDIGNTLIAHTSAVFDVSHEGWKKAWFERHYPDKKRHEIVESVRIVESNIKSWKLVDPLWPQVIERAQKCGSKVVALTKVVVDPSLKGLRINNLRNLGLPITDDLVGLSSGQSYVYADGVIETEASLKGPVLKELLSKLPGRPAKIVFVDDRLEQAQSVDAACKEIGIPCMIFHYTASQKTVAKLDERIADYQLRMLMKERRWLSEEEAARELKR